MNRGGVYEGELTVVEGGAVEIELKGYEGEDVTPLRVRLDLEPDGALRQRVWTRDGADPALILDVRHRKVAKVI